MKVPIPSVEGGGAKGKTRYSLLLPLTMETLCAFNYSVTVGKGIHFRHRGFMCYSIHTVHFSCHWHRGKLHIDRFGDFHGSHCASFALVFQLFSKDTPQKGCFLLIPLMALVLEQQEKCRSRARCFMDL